MYLSAYFAIVNHLRLHALFAASAVMPQWQPILHSLMPGAEWLLKDGFCLGMPDSSGCEFATDEELETELGMMLPSQHKLPL
jgi:hypothetical protein